MQDGQDKHMVLVWVLCAINDNEYTVHGRERGTVHYALFSVLFLEAVVQIWNKTGARRCRGETRQQGERAVVCVISGERECVVVLHAGKGNGNGKGKGTGKGEAGNQEVRGVLRGDARSTRRKTG